MSFRFTIGDRRNEWELQDRHRWAVFGDNAPFGRFRTPDRGSRRVRRAGIGPEFDQIRALGAVSVSEANP